MLNQIYKFIQTLLTNDYLVSSKILENKGKHPKERRNNVLQTQVNYWTLVENKRHNLATEDISWNNLFETKRHNVATEELGWADLAERSRHNVVTEGQGQANIDEAIRSHKAQEALGWENASIGWANASANRISAQANASNARTRYGEFIFSQSRWNDEYALREQQNAIAQQQADASTQQATNAFLNYGVAQNQLGINWYNASIAAQNANSNQIRAYADAFRVGFQGAGTISSEARGWYNALTDF